MAENRKIHVSSITYVDPPWRSMYQMALNREFCMKEHEIFYGHCQVVNEWSRQWAAFKRQPADNWMNVEDWIERPSDRPPCHCNQPMWDEDI